MNTCKLCGGKFQAKTQFAKYCPDCRRDVLSSNAKKHNLSKVGVDARHQRNGRKCEKELLVSSRVCGMTPCAECGSSENLYVMRITDDRKTGFMVMCDKCGESAQEKPTIVSALRAWRKERRED